MKYKAKQSKARQIGSLLRVMAKLTHSAGECACACASVCKVTQTTLSGEWKQPGEIAARDVDNLRDDAWLQAGSACVCVCVCVVPA